MHAKKLYQVIKEKQVIAVLLSNSEEECKEYLINQNIVDSLENIEVIEVAKKETKQVDNVIPLMIAKKSSWYDLRHYRHLYIYENE